MNGNCIVAQSGGPTAVINSSACGVIQEALGHREIAGVYAAHVGIPGVPKTIDNDLALADHCPGYGSVIKYLATMVMEAGRDTEALCTADTCNVIDAMGRNAGGIAAGTALARRDDEDAPHLIPLPEAPFDRGRFTAKVAECRGRYRRCVVVVSEGTKTADGSSIAEQKGDFARDSSDPTQFGGAAGCLKGLIEHEVKAKSRFAFPSTIQRNGIHFASKTDAGQASLVGMKAVQLALQGVRGRW